MWSLVDTEATFEKMTTRYQFADIDGAVLPTITRRRESDALPRIVGNQPYVSPLLKLMNKVFPYAYNFRCLDLCLPSKQPRIRRTDSVRTDLGC